MLPEPVLEVVEEAKETSLLTKGLSGAMGAVGGAMGALFGGGAAAAKGAKKDEHVVAPVANTAKK